MRFFLALAALAAVSHASICSQGKYVYKKCKFNVDCNAKSDGYINYTYDNVKTFKSCIQQCLTGEYACDGVNYSEKKNTCALVLSPSGANATSGVDFAEKTTSQACGNVG